VGRGCFETAARRQTMADVPIGLMASGGVDSSLIWWATRNHLSQAFTIEWPVGTGSERLEEDAATVRALRDQLETPTQFLDGRTATSRLLPFSGDLFADPAYDLARLISARSKTMNCKILFSGQGGDELLGGYRRHVVAHLASVVRNRSFSVALRLARRTFPKTGLRAEYASRVLRTLEEQDPFRGYMHLCTYSSANERARVLGTTEDEVSDDRVWQFHQECYERLPNDVSFLRKAMFVDLSVYLPGLGLAYVDRAGMEYGVEIRVPWLDLELVRWSLTLPDRVLIRRGRGKWLGRQLAAHTFGQRVGHRSKRGFASPSPSRGTGEKGFRQAAYFDIARDMVQQFRNQSERPY
jgi:asparagine synthase (glutamine-hydrolysing)